MTAPNESRYRGLDGLRGLAAVVVVVHHVLLMHPPLADAYRGHPALPAAEKALTFSPLHLVWAGTEAVLVFFVLSGFVLSVGALGQRRPSWVDYYPRRVLRLYLPVAAALVVALPQARWLRPKAPDAAASWVFNAHVGTGTLHNAARDVTLAHQHATWLDGPLWSLHWEVLFSLALPAYLLLVRASRRLVAALALVVLLAVTGYGVHRGWDSLVYLPVFGVGVLITAHRDALRLLARRWSLGLALVGGLLLTTRWTATGLHDLSRNGLAGATVLTVLGAGLVVVAFLDGAAGRWAERDRVVRWLGLRSFSLYLTHAPVVVSLAYLLGDHPNPLVLLVLAVPVCLLVAELFGRFVEAPAHDLSKRVGRWCDARRHRTPA